MKKKTLFAMATAAWMLALLPMNTAFAAESHPHPKAATTAIAPGDTVAEDTTFFYEGEDTDTVEVSEGAFDDFVQSVQKEFHISSDELPWWGSALLGLFAILMVTLLLILLTAPLWILALIIWLVIRNNRRQNAPVQTAMASGQATATGQSTSPSIFDAPKGTDAVLWRTGMNQCAWGVGLVTAALVLSSRLVAAVGLVLGCLGGSKLYLANREKKDANKSESA